jgi:hypothetical protein
MLNDRRKNCKLEQLYQSDAEYEDTGVIGRALLAQAKEECMNWRKEPLGVLVTYARL